MKFVALALLATSAAAFSPPSMTFAVGKKKAAPAKVAPKVSATKAVKKAVVKKVAPKPAPKIVAKAAPKPAPKPVIKKVVAKAAPKPAPKPVIKKVVAKAAPKPAPVVKKAPPKPAPKPAPKPKIVAAAPKPRPVPKPVTSFRSSGVVASAAIPYEEAPAILDGSLVGDVGFDPCFLSTKADLVANYFNGLFDGQGPTDGLVWYREAELMHGRICMVAVLGFIIPGFAHFAGNDWTGVDAYSVTNPLEAIGSVPGAALFQIFAFMSILEFKRINNILADGKSYLAGDSQKWGQGAGRWNPFGLNYTPAEYREKQLQEVKHARLAMIGFLGLVFQADASGVNVVDQWGAAFSAPEYYAKAGYFLPEGI